MYTILSFLVGCVLCAIGLGYFGYPLVGSPALAMHWTTILLGGIVGAQCYWHARHYLELRTFRLLPGFVQDVVTNKLIRDGVLRYLTQKAAGVSDAAAMLQQLADHGLEGHERAGHPIPGNTEASDTKLERLLANLQRRRRVAEQEFFAAYRLTRKMQRFFFFNAPPAEWQKYCEAPGEERQQAAS